MLEKIMLYLLGALTTGVGLLVMRFLRKEHVTEELARRKSAADLIAHLEKIGVPMERVDALLASIGRKRGDKVERPAKAPLTIEEQIEAREFAKIEAAQSQGEMNSLQADRARRLNTRMEEAFERLAARVDGDLRCKLDESQVIWLEFREKECAFAGAPWKGATMQPFITAGASSHVTKQRAEMLENHLAFFDDDR
jgi:uncharacterized protein YecT (DUF1311 family)